MVSADPGSFFRRSHQVEQEHVSSRTQHRRPRCAWWRVMSTCLHFPQRGLVHGGGDREG